MVRCPPCEGVGRLDVAHATSTVPAIALDEGSSLARLRLLGDWGELERLLAGLDEWSRRAWVACRVGQVGVELSDRAAVAEEWMLARRRWRCPASVLAAFEQAADRELARERARQKRVFTGGRRRLRIQELARQGMAVQAIAAACGVSPRTVSRALAS